MATICGIVMIPGPGTGAREGGDKFGSDELDVVGEGIGTGYISVPFAWTSDLRPGWAIWPFLVRCWSIRWARSPS